MVPQAAPSAGSPADPGPGRRAEAIAGAPRLTAIASARFDRTSFGCGSGASMTYFGEVYTRLLARHAGGARPLDRPGVGWPALFTALRGEDAAGRRAGRAPRGGGGVRRVAPPLSPPRPPEPPGPGGPPAAGPSLPVLLQTP